MSFLVSLKAVRLLLAFSVSVWLAGGCLLGCNAMAAQSNDDQTSEASVEGESCHVAEAHHCCSKAKSNPAKQSTVDPRLTASFLALASVPQGMMSDCPLAMNATAITSKANSNSQDTPQVASHMLPLTSGSGELPQHHVIVPLAPNRGPTYLRCCVFLI